MGYFSGRFALRSVLAGLIVAGALGGCASEPAYPVGQQATATDDRTPARQNSARIAAMQVGAPYRYGGASPRGFDCSGLVYYAYRRAGIRVPRTTYAQLHNAHRVPAGQLRPGDLVFFRLDHRPVSHVGIYAGNNRFVHAPSSGKRVTYGVMNDPYWQTRFVAAGRYN
jgi:cell wall-associated NlpC family hydrolase